MSRSGSAIFRRAWPKSVPGREYVQWRTRNLAFKFDKRRPASLREFDLSTAHFCESIEELLTSLSPGTTQEQWISVQGDWAHGAGLFPESLSNEGHRSGIGSKGQQLLFGLVRLLKPIGVVETGTHEGQSAAAIAFGMELNNIGKVTSLDIRPDVGQKIPEELRNRVNLVTSSLSASRDTLESLLARQPLIMLHDSDHSYENTRFELGLAKEFGIPIVVVDDADYNLGFLEWTRSDDYLFFYLQTRRKLIGVAAASDFVSKPCV